MPGNNLVIVESKGKVATITKYLNSSAALKHLGKFIVVACFGHVRDLPKKQLGIDIEHDFEPKFEMLADKKNIIDDLIKKSKGASHVYLATDADAEGAAISESLRQVLKLGENYYRITFTEITPRALEEAVLHPKRIDKNQVQSQQTRRTLDRLVGFKLSPLLWKKYTSGSTALSAGRVQSALMHLIIKREKDIEEFKTSSYWHFLGDFNLSIGKEKTQLEEVNMYKGDVICKMTKESDVASFFKLLKDAWSISNFKAKEVRQHPDAPFITSSLQQEASSKLRMSIKRTMQVAQELYEAGLITYMRTDSFNMSDDFKSEAKGYIEKTYGEHYYEGGVLRKKSVKGAQEAHECIRCTHVDVMEIDSKYEKNHKDLYKMIWQRSVAFLMKPAIFDELQVSLRDEGMPKDAYFSTTFKKLKFDGYLVVYDVKYDTKLDIEKYLGALSRGDYRLACARIVAKNTWMAPPARYNESGLVKLMEQTGIGRPSSYASILEKLFEKTYVIKANIKGETKSTIDYVYAPSTKKVKDVTGTVEVGGELSKVKPTEIGLQIDEYLDKNFEYIVNPNFTAYMESDLDHIAEGDKTRSDVLNVFWDRLKKDLAVQDATKVKKTVLKTEGKDVTVSGKTYTLRIAKYGPVIQYDSNKYINLKPYLALVKKQYTDINEDDISFLTKLPRDVGNVEGKPVSLMYGQYGLYVRHDGKNVAMTKKMAYAFLKNEDVELADIKSAIDYKKKTSDEPPKKKLVKKNIKV